MGTIAEKLSYLADTKDLFKDRLNSLGAEITSSATFRNYLNWLDTFYGEVSDKTDLSVNGVVGRTSQESTKGINVFNINNGGSISNEITLENNDYVSCTYDNSNGSNVHYSNLMIYKTSQLQASTDYLIVCEIKEVSGTGRLQPYTKAVNGSIDTNHSSFYFNSLSAGQKLIIPVTTKAVLERYDLRTLIVYDSGNSGSITFRLSLLTDTSITSDTFVYEKFSYGPSPNPNYPQPINNLSGDVAYKVSGKNLIGLGTQLNGYRDTSTSKFQTNANAVGYYFKTSDLPDTITFTGTNSNRSNVSYYNEIPALNVSSVDYSNSNSTPRTISVDKTYPYIHIQFSYNQEVSSIQVEKGNSSTSFEPYIEPQTFTIPLTSKNLFDKNTNNILNGYFEYTNDTIHSSGANRVLYYECKPNTTYAFTQGDTNISNHVFQVATTTTKPDIGVVVENFADKSGISSNKRFTYTTNTNAKYLVIRLRAGDTTNDFLNGVQIEENNEATSYEPYYNIELCEIDTYEDKIYSSNGRFYLDKAIGKLILNGSDNALVYYGLYGVDNAPLFYIDISAFIQPSNYNIAIIRSEHYKQWFTTASGAQYMVNNGIRGATTNNRIYIRDDRYTSANDINNWLSNNNDNVNYVLATPTTTEITQENYPSLYNALKQIQDYLTAYKINKEFILGYSSPEIEY